MKKLSIVLLSLILIGMAGSVWAAKPIKSLVLHCGCVWDDIGEVASMEYKEITISSKSKGHDAHVAGSIDSCYNGQVEVETDVWEDDYADFVRSGADCQLDGPELGDPIDFCPEEEPPVAGETCGNELNIQ